MPAADPVPLIVRGFAPKLSPPCKASAAPVATVTPELALTAEAFWRLSTPALTVVAPA